ncbi:MAG: flagellar type III secretion system protein FlhB [Betaproteobacteria bacterium]|nr:flagellar type III secretion system protein FlhB [Betaproteobacteria bacterium]
MAEESDSPRTEPASPRRLEQAREEGQIARSRELTTSLLLLAAGALFLLAGPHIVEAFLRILRRGLSLSSADAFDQASILSRLASLSTDGLIALAPALALLVLVSLIGPALIGGWIFASKAIQPDFSRLSPLRGIKLMFSWHAAGELAKAIAKALLVAVAASAAIWAIKGELLGLALVPVEQGPVAAGGILARLFLVVSASLALVAAFDVPFQIWRHRRGLRMTREEVRKDLRESEGDPQLKGRIRNEQRAMARRRMMQEVPKADVIVTNPTHYAVALAYRDSGMRAPTVVAKGAALVAARIRAIGEEHRVPVFEAPPLARALYFSTEIGAEIPGPLYNAVAQVLAYVYQLRRWQAGGGGAGRAAAPVVPQDLPVPPELDPQQAKA